LTTLPIVINAAALGLMLAVLFGMIFWSRPPSPVGPALAVLALSDSVLIGINLLIQVQGYVNATDPHLAVLTNLGVDVYALTTLTAFILAVAIGNVLREAYNVLIRAGLVLWVLFQGPLWQYELLSGPLEAGLSGIEINLESPMAFYAFMIILTYQGLTLWLVFRSRHHSRYKWLLWGLVVLQGGHILALIIPVLRVLGAATWVSAPAALLFGYSLFRERTAPAPA